MPGQNQRSITKKSYFEPAGYSKIYLLIDRFFSIMMSIILIFFSLPLYIIIYLIIKIKEGGPVFYNGTRLGLNKTPYLMYKFRTLAIDAPDIIGTELLTHRVAHKMKLVSDFGKFLRETRLDELPQLFNIIKGDMVFFGPRPVRPNIYEKYCKNLENYDNRFTIKPGLIGYSQLLTPHSSPKKIRNLIDNIFIKKKQRFGWEIAMISYIIIITIIKTITIGASFTWKNLVQKRLLKKFDEKRELDRIRPREADVSLECVLENKTIFYKKFRIQDINEEGFLLFSNIEIPEKELQIKMETQYSNIFGRRKRHKTARCNGSIYKKVLLNKSYKYAFIIKYEPKSPFNKYLVHQYFLLESII